MSIGHNVNKTSEVFNKLCDEIYFGFNFKLELGANPEMMEALDKFLDTCKAARQSNKPI